MDLNLDVWKDPDGIHFQDSISRIGVHFKNKAAVVAFLKQNDGEEWEQSFREAIREIVKRYSEIDQPLNNKIFTYTSAKAVTTWP